MNIGKKYKIESDSLNVILYRKERKKDGGIRWKAICFFATLGGALKELVNLEVRLTQLKDLETVVKKQEELMGLIGKLDPHSLVRSGRSEGQVKR